jgi:hypothetical protein
MVPYPHNVLPSPFVMQLDLGQGFFKQNLKKLSHPEKLPQVETPFYFNIFNKNLQKPVA